MSLLSAPILTILVALIVAMWLHHLSSENGVVAIYVRFLAGNAASDDAFLYTLIEFYIRNFL